MKLNNNPTNTNKTASSTQHDSIGAKDRYEPVSPISSSSGYKAILPIPEGSIGNKDRYNLLFSPLLTHTTKSPTSNDSIGAEDRFYVAKKPGC